MKRAVTVLVLLAAAPSLAAAQGIMTTEAAFGPRVRITPYIGAAPTVSRTERWAIDNGGLVSYGRLETDLGAGPALGLAVDARLADRFGLIFSGNYINRGDTRQYSADDGVFFEAEGSTFLTAKAALALRLFEPQSEMQLRRLTASVYAGPAWIYEMPSDAPSAGPSFTDNISHWAANVGVDANVPFAAGKFELQLSVEDYYTFWNASALAEQIDNASTGQGFTTTSSVEVDNSHMLLIRAGLSIRLR